MSRRLKLTPEVVATIWRLRMIQRWTVPKIARELALATSTVERALAGRSKQNIKARPAANEPATHNDVDINY